MEGPRLRGRRLGIGIVIAVNNQPNLTEPNTIHCVDCMDGLREMPDDYVDLAIVDPPYGKHGDKQINYGTTTRVRHLLKNWDDNIPIAEYFIELRRVSTNQIIWGGNYFLDYLHNTKCFVVWDKMNGGNNMADCELA